VLSDESKRKQYDTYGMAGESFGGQGPFGAARGARSSAAGNGSEFLLFLPLAIKFTILKFPFFS
jgi:DnaJ-class molecular chaperone